MGEVKMPKGAYGWICSCLQYGWGKFHYAQFLLEYIILIRITGTGVEMEEHHNELGIA